MFLKNNHKADWTVVGSGEQRDWCEGCGTTWVSDLITHFLMWHMGTWTAITASTCMEYFVAWCMGNKERGWYTVWFLFITEVHPCLPTGALSSGSFQSSGWFAVLFLPLRGHVLLHCLWKMTQVWLGPKGTLAEWGWMTHFCCSVQSSSKCWLMSRCSLWGIVSARRTVSSYFLSVSRGWHSLYSFWKEHIICMSRYFTNKQQKKVCLYLCGLIITT